MEEYAVANSLGVFGYDTQSSNSLSAVVMSDTGPGYAERNSVFNALGRKRLEAIDKALKSRNQGLPQGSTLPSR